MVYIIKGETANELFINISKEMMSTGVVNAPRGLKTIELQDAWLELSNPLESIVSLPERALSMKYLKGEMEWYESGSLNVNDIACHSSFWKKLADTNGTVNSNYGFLVMKEKWAGKSQLEWCIDSLKKDPCTRQAVMNYNQPRHKYCGNKDFVCATAQQFIKRNDKLDTIVLMRSNDLIFGLSYDMPWFTSLQQRVSEETGIPLGIYYHYDTSLHVYEKHFDMVKKISEIKTTDDGKK